MGAVNSCFVRCCPRLAGTDRIQLSDAAAGDATNDNEDKLLSPIRTQSEYFVKDHFNKSVEDVLKRPSPLKKKLAVDRVVRVVLIGESATGKTCLLRRYLNNYYDNSEESTDYFKTLGVDFGCKTVEVQGARVRLQLWDTGGEKKYAPVVSHYLHGADGVVLTYDVTKRSSFVALESRWLPFLQEHRPKAVCMMLVGTKTDLTAASRGGGGADGEARVQEVDTVEAQNWADVLGIPFFEVSSKDASNVDFAMLGLIRMVLDEQAAAAATEGIAAAGVETALWSTLFAKDKSGVAVTSSSASSPPPSLSSPSTLPSTPSAGACDNEPPPPPTTHTSSSSSSSSSSLPSSSSSAAVVLPSATSQSSSSSSSSSSAASQAVAAQPQTAVPKKKKRLMPISVPRPENESFSYSGGGGGDGQPFSGGGGGGREGYAPVPLTAEDDHGHDSGELTDDRSSSKRGGGKSKSSSSGGGRVVADWRNGSSNGSGGGGGGKVSSEWRSKAKGSYNSSSSSSSNNSSGGGGGSDVTSSFRARAEAAVRQLKVVIPASDDDYDSSSASGDLSSRHDRRRPLSPIA